MAFGDPQTGIAMEVAASYDRPIVVSVINKLSEYPFLQELGYNGILGWLQKGFLGLNDFFNEMSLYSSTNSILVAAWKTIIDRVPLNLDMATNLIADPWMGTVGNAFLRLIGFDQVFAVDADQLKESTGSDVVSSTLGI